MDWWCTSLSDPWTWQWRAYPGIWLATALLAVPWLLSVRRHRRETGESGVTTRQRWQFGAGVVLFWLITDWPVGTLGASYLASVHMLQWTIYTGVVAPLLMLGTPDWMARRLLDHLRLRGAATRLSRPLIAGLLFNAVLLVTHAPVVTDPMRASAIGSMTMDAAWLLAGFVVWLPVVSPLRSLRATSYPIKIVYLFLAMGVVPMIPGAFLTLSDYPLYATFELAPRATSLTAAEDQRLAGVMMKLGGMPVIWPVMAVMFFRWFSQEEAADKALEDAARRVEGAAT